MSAPYAGTWAVLKLDIKTVIDGKRAAEALVALHCIGTEEAFAMEACQKRGAKGPKT